MKLFVVHATKSVKSQEVVAIDVADLVRIGMVITMYKKHLSEDEDEKAALESMRIKEEARYAQERAKILDKMHPVLREIAEVLDCPVNDEWWPVEAKYNNRETLHVHVSASTGISETIECYIEDANLIMGGRKVNMADPNFKFNEDDLLLEAISHVASVKTETLMRYSGIGHSQAHQYKRDANIYIGKFAMRPTVKMKTWIDATGFNISYNFVFTKSLRQKKRKR